MERIKLTADDNPLGLATLDVEDGAVVIVVEHGMIEVGRYRAPAPPERPHPAFERPSNGGDLRTAAYQAVVTHFPGLKIGGKLKVFRCPDELAERASWPAPASDDDAPSSSDAPA